MRIQRSSHQGYVVLALAGRLDLAAAPQVQRAILKQLAEQPPAVICDLAQVEAIDPLCAAVFSSIWHPALGWPGTALVLCGTRPAVADVLVRQGVARRVAMYPSLDQALRGARDRPPQPRERLALDPVPTAAGAGRAFLGEVCGRWGLQGLAGSAALLASELVTNAVVHARTALELRVEVRGSQLHVAVKDQDPNLPRLLAANEGTRRGLGLLIVDRVATAWGGQQDGTGGKTVWCTLDLPPPDAALAGRGRQLQASTRTASMAVGMDGADQGLADAMAHRVPSWCGASCSHRCLEQDFYRVPDSRCGFRPVCRASSACSTRRLGSARRRCLPSGALVPVPAGWPGCRWTRATTTRPASGCMWSRRCGPSSPTRARSRSRPCGARARTCTGRCCRRCSTS